MKYYVKVWPPRVSINGTISISGEVRKRLFKIFYACCDEEHDRVSPEKLDEALTKLTKKLMTTAAALQKADNAITDSYKKHEKATNGFLKFWRLM